MAKRKRPPLKKATFASRTERLAAEGNPFAIISLMASGKLTETEYAEARQRLAEIKARGAV